MIRVEFTIGRRHLFVLVGILAVGVLVVPGVSWAASRFDDVPDDSVFVADIEWLADAGITKGCNPPANTRFCPGSNVTREQMAAFMHRFAINQVVDAATAVEADNADTLDGKDSGAFMTKAAYDADSNGVVDSAEIKIRYADGDFFVDMADPATDRMRCITAPVTFGTATTVVAAGGLSLQPWGAINAYEIWGDVYYSTDSGASWAIFDNLSLEDTPPGGTGNAAIALNSAKTLDAAAYIFGIQPFGDDAGEGDDYSGYCQLTVTAYTGQGPDTDFVVTLVD